MPSHTRNLLTVVVVFVCAMFPTQTEAAVQWQTSPECPAFCSPAYSPNSWDFLTCSQDQWIGIHVAAPFMFYVFTQDLVFTFLASALNEGFESLFLLFFNNYGPIFGFVPDPEPMEASLVGDFLFQTTWGVAIGFFMVKALRAPKFFPTIQEHGLQSRQKWEVWWKVLIAFGLYNASNLLATLKEPVPAATAANGYFYFGLIAAVLGNAAALMLLYWWTLTPADTRLIWSRYQGRDAYPEEVPPDLVWTRRQRREYLFLVWIVCLALLIINFVPQFLASIYFQTWLVAACFIVPFAMYYMATYNQHRRDRPPHYNPYLARLRTPKQSQL